MNHPSYRYLGAAALIALFVPTIQAVAQQHVPPAPVSQAAAPSAPAPTAAPVFPVPDAANFTAASPTKETVNDFLHANWGYDENRIWQVQGILKTPAEGISKVVVLLADKNNAKAQTQVLSFFVLPGGNQIISGDSIIAFGAHPFAELRQQVQQRADGPYRGAASKDLELVEFADFQCPHCKEAQANMEKLSTDFPKAHYVFQLFPLASIHPQATRAAQYGYCVQKLGASTAFFQFASAVFDGQEGLETADGATLTLNSAVAKAGLDTAKVAACAASPEAKTNVEADVKLANDLGISQVPMLVINGRMVPANAPYDILKKIIEFQAKLDGVAAE